MINDYVDNDGFHDDDSGSGGDIDKIPHINILVMIIIVTDVLIIPMVSNKVLCDP